MVPRIFRGDDTDANGRTVEIQLPDEDMAGFRMRFEFLGRAFEFDELPRGGSVRVDFGFDDTAMFPLGTHYGTIRLQKNGRWHTVSNTVPLTVSDEVGAVYGGDASAIHLELKFNSGIPDLTGVNDSPANANELARAFKSLLDALKGAPGTLVMSALALCMCAFGEQPRLSVQSAPLGEVAFSSRVVTNVTFDAEGLATNADVDSKVAAATNGLATAADVESKADKATTLAGYGITDAVPLVEDSSGKKTSVTIGSRNGRVGVYSLANGKDVTASGYHSHAEGYNTASPGSYSHAEGRETVASGDYSHTEGFRSQTKVNDNFAYSWNGDGTRTEPYFSHGEGTFNVNPAGGLGGFWIGEQTLEAIIAAAISGKANKSELPYSLVVKEIENGTVSLDDRADNYVDARALGSSDSLDVDFPVLVDGRSRDFVLAVECGENPPTISYAAFATIMAEDASTLTPEPGMNIYAFTEFKTNMFLAACKTVDTVVVNTPESSNQVLLAMQKRGIDTTNITDFGEVANTLGLGDTATPQDAIDAVMN